jgi:hypothetical protein
MVGIAEGEVVVCVEEATGVTVEVCLFTCGLAEFLKTSLLLDIGQCQ